MSNLPWSIQSIITTRAMKGQAMSTKYKKCPFCGAVRMLYQVIERSIKLPC